MIKIVTITLLLVVLLDNANSQPTTRHSPFSTFISHLQDFVRNPLYAQLIARERALYRRNGYYVDPKYVLPYTSAPTRCPPSSSNPNNPCYNVHYYPNGYAIAGYDREGYDINGYNLAGYNRSGYSRRVAKRGQLPPSAYDQLGNFLNPIYQSNGYRVIFDNYGNPYMGDEVSGPITPSNPCYNTSAYEVLVYDRDGYDQYGNDIYGNPVYQYPPPCTRPPDSYSNIPDVGLICNSSSEIRLPNGKYRYIRKSASAMTTSDWQRFRNAWNNLVTTGEIGRLVEIHAQNFNQHQSPRFLPWHREFTARLEDALHRMDPCVFLPYWDVIQMPSFPQGVADTFNPEFPPDVILLNSMGQLVMTTPVNTAIGINGLLPNAGLQSAVLAQATFPVFSQAVEAFHDQIHVYVGGSLMFIATAPRHPVFYLLHANIDRLWHIWQQTHLGQPINSVITTLNPLTYGSSDTRTYAQESNINNVQTVRGNGYQYI